MLGFPAGLAAQTQPLLESPLLSIHLLSFQQAEGQIDLMLQCRNDTDAPLQPTLFAPTANALPASFRYGWGAQSLSLEPGEQQFSLTIYTDNPGEWVHSWGFRIILGNEITGPLQWNEETGAVPSDFYWQQREDALLDATPLPVTRPQSEPLVFSDALPPEQLEKLDYGQMQICLSIEVEGRPCLVPFMTVPVQALPSGGIQAVYSGYALVSSLDPAFPLAAREIREAGGIRFEAEDLHCFGPFIFFSSLSAAWLLPDGANEAILAASAIDGVETDVLFANLPLEWITDLQCSHLVIRLIEKNGLLRPDTADVISMEAALDQPLSFRLIPVESLGQIYGYFEYFFTDQTDVIHPPFPLFP